MIRLENEEQRSQLKFDERFQEQYCVCAVNSHTEKKQLEWIRMRVAVEHTTTDKEPKVHDRAPNKGLR